MRRTFSAALATVLTAAVALSSISPAFAQGEKKDDLEFEPDSAQATPPSKTLERAVKLYEKKDYPSASIELQKVLNGESGDDARNKQRAEFFMGKTLYYLNFYAGALAYFDRIVQAGAAHTYHGATLKWLAALSRVLPETSGILEKIGGYDAAALEDPIMAQVRDELYYLLGRHFYRRGADGDFEKAIELFQRVARDSEFFIKAKFFEGVTHVRKFEGKPAVEARCSTSWPPCRWPASSTRPSSSTPPSSITSGSSRARPTGPSRCSRRPGPTS
jgi:tetratricopeptide (TPR) repeat protein